MSSKNYISSYCKIKSNTIVLNDDIVFKHEDAEDFLAFIKSAYKDLNTNYPKFFKMDELSKLSFLASDLLLKNEQLNPESKHNIAIVLSNKASSLMTDRAHQKTIQNEDNYFPSPAIFVYTLPNICIGEISIKHELYSENSFFIFDNFNAQHLFDYANSLINDEKADKVLCGWVDYDTNHYDAFVYLIETEGRVEHTPKSILKIYNT